MGSVVDIDRDKRIKVKTKDGFFPVANQLMDALCSINLNGRQFRLVNTVMRLTYGWKQDMVEFNRAQLAELSDLPAREVSRLKSSLVKCNILIDKEKEIGINPYIEDWISPDKRQNKSVHSHTDSVQVHTNNQEEECAFSHQEVCIPTPEGVHSHTKPALPSLPLNTIKNNIKDTSQPAAQLDDDSPKNRPDSVIQNKSGSQWGTQEDLDLAKYIFENVKQIFELSREPSWAAWANDIRLMREQDKRELNQIEKLFRFANAHERFWQRNIRCPKTLRKQWSPLVAEYKHQRDQVRGESNLQTQNRLACEEAKKMIFGENGENA